MDCIATLDGDVLTLDTGAMRRTFTWNRGNPITREIEDRVRGKVWDLVGEGADAEIPGSDGPVGNGELLVEEIGATAVHPAYLRATVTAQLGPLRLRRVFRLYEDCPAIACDFYLKGVMPAVEASHPESEGSLPNIEDAGALVPSDLQVTRLDTLRFPGVHQRIEVVRFFDITDRNNNLARSHRILPYRSASRLIGSVLFIDPLLEAGGLFVLKESPNASAHLAYPGFDFVARENVIQTVGIGVRSGDVNDEEWTRAYGVVTGVTGDDELSRLSALRAYQNCVRTRLPDRDEMVLMNTWGDRGQDTKISETFALAELEGGARLGVSHLQLDDGWQSGQTSNSAFKGGSLENIWDDPDYWTPHPERFPNGLAAVVDRAKALGIELCLWFNPSADESYGHWESDAQTLIRLNREHGIRTFKIDGVKIPDKDAEVNLRRMFDAVVAATDGDVVFNLDTTAGRRFGFHTFNEYGNFFLENRYTDWSNYYPHWTLRNLWSLARCVPPQNLQIEFLNRWRNADKYTSSDPLAPQNVPFEYCFAITMMAQPLAWFESTGLPEEAFALGDVIRAYREHQRAIHEGCILPIGDEPCGTGWTGFQSLGEGAGYVAVYRGWCDRDAKEIALYDVEGRSLAFEPVCGQGGPFKATADGGGRVRFSLPDRYTYGLYQYRVTG